MAFILASASPRRQELLRLMGIEDFTVCPASGEPELTGLAPDETVRRIARFKAEQVAARFPGDTVIAADTLVFLDGTALGKPHDAEDARRMLHLLSGRRHAVYTGVAVICGEDTLAVAVRTDVFFRSLTDEEIEAYIHTGEPMDKAGAYGAQGRAAVFIERIEGDFFNVMGLPVCALTLMLRRLGVRA
jgi:septum formation protein